MRGDFAKQTSNIAPNVTMSGPQAVNSNYSKASNGTTFTLISTYAIITVTINNCIHHKGGEIMEVLTEMNNGEIIRNAIEDFKKVQKHMLSARKEHAMETYEGLKDDYLSLKVLLHSLGVNLTDIDKIKE